MRAFPSGSGALTAKMAREAFQKLPGVRVFFVDALRDHARDGSPCGVNEVTLRHGKIVREGLHTTLTNLRLRKNHRTARECWHREMCAGPALPIVGRDRSKLGLVLAARIHHGAILTRHGHPMDRHWRFLRIVPDRWTCGSTT
jgi:hypothetical protein